MDNSFDRFLLENLTLRIFMTTRQTISVYHKNEILMSLNIFKFDIYLNLFIII